MTTEQNNDLYQVAMLIDQLKHDDIVLRVNASKFLVKIAKALGPARTREELLPFIKQSVDDEDEVLNIIANKLGELIPLVGGSQYVHLLLEPLELLATVDENSVREAVVASTELVILQLSNEHLVEHYVPFVLRMAGKDLFTSRVSAASLFHVGYKNLPAARQREFRTMYFKLCADDAPMVRRAAASNLSNLAREAGLVDVQQEFLDPFRKLSEDDQDSVRIQTAQNCVALANLLPAELKVSRIRPVVVAIANDKSWRVRWSLATHLHNVCLSLGPEITNNSLVGICEGFLSDNEPEVRSTAAAHIPAFSAIIRKDLVVARIILAAHRLVADSSELVRCSLACVLNDMASILGKDDTIQHLLPLLLLFLRDESSEVRLNVISKLGTINEVIGVDLLSHSLLPAIVDLSEDSKWRVRVAIIEHIPMLAEKLGTTFFGEKLNSLCMTWLSDDVYSVRRAATENLKKLVELFGDEWSRENIIPRIERMHEDNNYLKRMTALYCIQVISSCLSPDSLDKIFMSIVLKMTKDTVPNVRFNAAKTLEKMYAVLKGTESSADIVEVLSTLQNDPDRDVRFFSSESLGKIQTGDKMNI